MDTQSIIITAVATLILLIVIFSVMKGVLKMLLLSIAIIGAVAVWLFLQKSGYTFMTMAGFSPEEWMVQVVAYLAALSVFIVFYHGMRWFSQLFSVRKKASPGMVVTTILFCVLMMWVMLLALSYAGDISRVQHFHERAVAAQQDQDAPQLPFFCEVKDIMRGPILNTWLAPLDPIEDPALTNLACLVAYGCTLNEEGYTEFHQNYLAHSGIVHAGRFKRLFADPDLRKLVEDGRFVQLMENEQLKSFLQLGNSEEIMLHIIKPRKD